MSSSLVKSKADEKLWAEATKIAMAETQKFGDDFDSWALVSHLFQNMKRSQASKIQHLHQVTQAMFDLEEVINEELQVIAEVEGDYQELMEKSPAEFAARYWLMQFLEPLSRKELKSIIDGFMVQMMSEDQAKALAKFLLIRFPQYYSGGVEIPDEKLKLYDQIKRSADAIPGGPKPEVPEGEEPEIEEDQQDEPGEPLPEV